MIFRNEYSQEGNMKIEVWSDFSCPFCYIGKRNLDEALKLFPQREQVKVHFRSFELNPHAPIHTDQDLFDILAQKFNATREQVIEMNNTLADKAKEVGLLFHFDKVIPTNTFLAHRLFIYAQQRGKGYEMAEQLFKAYFTDGKHIGEINELIKLATQVGLEKEQVEEVLQNNYYEQDVRNDQQKATELGVTGVPFFVFNDSYAISGALPVEMFLDTLEKCWNNQI